LLASLPVTVRLTTSRILLASLRIVVLLASLPILVLLSLSLALLF